MKRHHWVGSLQVALVGILLTFVGGCASTTFKVKFEEPPARRYQAIAVGNLGEGKFEEAFRSSLVEGLKSSSSFARVLDPAPETLPSSTVVVSGGLDGWGGGYVFGFGANADAWGHFKLKDSTGAILAEFGVVRESGEDASLELDDEEMAALFHELGHSAADALSRWAQGKGLAP